MTRPMILGDHGDLLSPPIWVDFMHTDCRIDVLTEEGLAIESGVGYTSLTPSMASQIAKDQLLLETGDVSGVQWGFRMSELTGRVGPSGPLAARTGQGGESHG